MTTGEAKKRQPRVVVFSTPTCPHCRTAKRYLQQKGVRFTDIDVSRDFLADLDRLTPAEVVE